MKKLLIFLVLNLVMTCLVFAQCGDSCSTNICVDENRAISETQTNRYSTHKYASYLTVLDPMTDTLLEGYNKSDYTIYFKDYAQSMAALKTEQMFNSLILNMYKKDADQYISRELMEERCSFNEGNPLVVYKGNFKNGIRIISVNFVKEDNNYKVMQLTISKAN